MEYETESLLPEQLMNSIPNTFSLTNDASINTDVKMSESGIIIRSVPEQLQRSVSFRPVVIGSEIISIPFDTESGDFLSQLKYLTNLLQSLGEPAESYRAGIHFHICMPINLPIIKNILRLGLALEDVFFHLGGQGYPFRGTVVNESLYCRPITKCGPTVVRTNMGYAAQCYNVNAMLEADTMREFWVRYGDVSTLRDLDKYHPVRYSWLNIYSMLAHNTLEFRVFNKTMNPHYLWAEVRFCMKFCEYALYNAFSKEPRPDEVHSIYDNRPKEEISRTLSQYCSMFGVDGMTFDILSSIIDRTPSVVIPEGYLWSHVNGRSYWGREHSGNYRPISIPLDEIRTVKVQDIHTLRGERN